MEIAKDHKLYGEPIDSIAVAFLAQKHEKLSDERTNPIFQEQLFWDW